ncbi:MAG: hypothetical protein L3J39_11775 [Verrucomicrobiales bacterium]|nr:hypothetical protein [Verrucomicrobiales bacterium]
MYAFVKNDGVNDGDNLGLEIISGESAAYRNIIKAALEKIIGSKLKWSKMDSVRKHTKIRKNNYWCLSADGAGGGDMFSKLAIGMAKGEPTIEIVDSPNTQFALSGSASRYRRVTINDTISSGVPLETGNKDQFGLPTYSKARIPDLAPNLWHELVGHAILRLNHPLTQDNVYEYVRIKSIIEYGRGNTFKVNLTPDPAVEEENKARKILKLKLRRPQYLDIFYPRGHPWYVRKPGNWDRLIKNAGKVKVKPN